MNVPPEPDVSVVMATYNGADYIGAQLDALVGQEGGVAFELIVADNGSVDRTTQIVSDFASAGHFPVRLVDARTSRGQGFARNEGARYARAAKLVFLDQDDVAAPDYVRAMSDALDHHAIVGARLDIGLLNPGWRPGSRRPAQLTSLGGALRFLPYAGGSTLGLQRHVFEAVGGFDPSMPGAAEDVDLCWRVQLAGWDLAYADEALLHYRYRSTLRAQLRQAFGYGQAEVTLYHVYRARGMRRRTVAASLRSWLLWGRSVVRIRSKADLAKVGWKLAHDVGMATSCIRLRTFYP